LDEFFSHTDLLGVFHCHMESSHCAVDETWIRPSQVSQYGECGCSGDDYATNAHLTTCYDQAVTHQVVCAYDGTQCPEGWLNIGDRFNADHAVDQCSHETAAFTNDDPHTNTSELSRTEESSCGKRCTCNFHYQSRDNVVTAGSSVYGACYDPVSHQARCAVSNTTCAISEIWINPHDGQLRDKVCNCDDTYVGACMDDQSFSHCAIQADGCNDGQSFMTARELLESDGMNMDCRLCINTWETVAVNGDDSPPKDTDAAENSSAGRRILTTSLVDFLFQIM